MNPDLRCAFPPSGLKYDHRISLPRYKHLFRLYVLCLLLAGRRSHASALRFHQPAPQARVRAHLVFIPLQNERNMKCVSVSPWALVNLRIIRLHSEVGESGQRGGHRPPTEPSADGPQLFATGCNKSYVDTNSESISNSASWLNTCRTPRNSKKEKSNKKRKSDTTTTTFEGWSSWTLPGNHQSRNAPPSDDNTNQTRTKWLNLSCLWPLPTELQPLNCCCFAL